MRKGLRKHCSNSTFNGIFNPQLGKFLLEYDAEEEPRGTFSLSYSSSLSHRSVRDQPGHFLKVRPFRVSRSKVRRRLLNEMWKCSQLGGGIGVRGMVPCQGMRHKEHGGGAMGMLWQVQIARQSYCVH